MTTKISSKGKKHEKEASFAIKEAFLHEKYVFALFLTGLGESKKKKKCCGTFHLSGGGDECPVSLFARPQSPNLLLRSSTVKKSV